MGRYKFVYLKVLFKATSTFVRNAILKSRYAVALNSTLKRL